ncbi:MAG: zinc ribbon domain-containing protein [Planctomycetota bacterium]|nr:zinc ribbon domain-containing protein [Planctomycetota bacterium]
MTRLWPTYIGRELALNKAQRKAIHREAWRLWLANRWNLVIYLIYIPLGVLVMIIARDLLGLLASVVGAGGMTYKAARIAGLLLGLIGYFVLGGAVLQRWRFAPCVWRALRARGHEVCPNCGYWLRDLPDDEDRCPECGALRQTMT